MAKKGFGKGVEKLFETKKEKEEPKKYRTTLYLTEDDIAILDALQTIELRKEKMRIDRSAIIRRALAFYYQNTKTS